MSLRLYLHLEYQGIIRCTRKTMKTFNITLSLLMVLLAYVTPFSSQYNLKEINRSGKSNKLIKMSFSDSSGEKGTISYQSKIYFTDKKN